MQHHRNHHRRTRKPMARAAAAMVAGAVLAPLLVVANHHEAIAAVDDRFPRVAEVDVSTDNGGSPGITSLLADVNLRRLVVGTTAEGLRLIDLDHMVRAPVPGQEATQGPNGVIPYRRSGGGFFSVEQMALDPVRHRVFVSEQQVQLPLSCPGVSGPLDDVNPGADDRLCALLPRKIWTASLIGEFAGWREFALPTHLPEGLASALPDPGFDGHEIVAMTYDAASDTLFVVSAFDVAQETPVTGPITGASSVVVLRALSGSALARGDGNPVRWSYELPACGAVLGNDSLPAVIDLADDGSFLSVPCRGLPISTPSTSGLNSRQAGIALVRFNSADPAHQHPVQFVTEYHPFAGDLSQGFATADTPGDRQILVSTSAGSQLLTIFDSTHRSYVGAVPLGAGNVRAATADPSTGRIYAIQESDSGGDNDVLRVSEGRAIPAVLGALGSLEGVYLAKAPTFDPRTRRLFAARDKTIDIYEDRTPAFEVPDRRDPDVATHDIDEAIAASVDFGGGAERSGAFGYRAFLANGVNAALGVIRPDEALPTEVRPEGGNRGVFLARVAGAQLRGDTRSAQATAQAVGASIDDATASDLAEKTDPTGLTPRNAPVADQVQNACKSEPPPLVGQTLDRVAPGLYGQLRQTVRTLQLLVDQLVPDDQHPDNGCDALMDPLKQGHSDFDRQLDDGLEEGFVEDEDEVDEHGDDTVDDGLEDVPHTDDLLADAVKQFKPSECRDFGSGPDPELPESNPGSSVTCNAAERLVVAHATTSEQMDSGGPLPVRVAHASSTLTIEKTPDLGIVTTAEAVTQGVDLFGLAHIGEVRTKAVTRAKGRTGTAGSTFEFTIDAVRIAGLGEEPLFTCGIPLPGDRGQGPCDQQEVIDELNRRLGTRASFRGPTPETDPMLRGSPGGAQAVIYKDDYSYWNDVNLNNDTAREVSGLQVTVYNDNQKSSRLIVQLAGVQAESHYEIGDEFVEPPPEPAGLEISLSDPEGEPLAGGVFEVHEDRDDDGVAGLGDPRRAGPCTTGTDGMGDCTFIGLEPGPYVIRQVAAPEGFEPTDEVQVTIEKGFTTSVQLFNVPSFAVVEGRQAIPATFLIIEGGPRPIVSKASLDDEGFLRRLLGAPLDGLRLLRRNLREALLILSMWLVLATPLWLRRRRELMNRALLENL